MKTFGEILITFSYYAIQIVGAWLLALTPFYFWEVRRHKNRRNPKLK